MTALRAGRVAAAVAAAGALVYGWQVGRPGVWMDEAATLDVARRSLSQVFALVRHEDLVHLVYYLLAKPAWADDMVAVPMEVRMLRQAYPQLAGLHDPTVAVEPLSGATLEGSDVHPDQVPGDLAGHPRIWLVRGLYQADDLLTPSERAALAALTASYRPQSRKVFSDIEVTLMVRSGA